MPIAVPYSALRSGVVVVESATVTPDPLTDVLLVNVVFVLLSLIVNVFGPMLFLAIEPVISIVLA